ncbi:cupin domain-containing protein [Bisporella sp. PMI_857]|nr:cupin domain-containing protein [Bisporella sp. PMI_857]
MSAETDRGLTHPKRFITAHDETGKAVFSSSIPEPVEFEQIPNDAIFSLCYATNTTPVNLGSNNDIKTYNQYLNKKPGVMIPGGSVLRMVDMPPGATSPMHRTTSLDYGVVLAGNVELILDSGEVRAMRVGDMSVQRGTMHAWRNMSKTEWARMLYILLEAEPLELAGKVLGEDYGGLQVPASSRADH